MHGMAPYAVESLRLEGEESTNIAILYNCGAGPGGNPVTFHGDISVFQLVGLRVTEATAVREIGETPSIRLSQPDTVVVETLDL